MSRYLIVGAGGIGVTVAAGSPVTLQASLEQPNYAYFANAELPKLLTRPMGQAAGTLGVSTVTLSGILGVIQCAGLDAAYRWFESQQDRKKYTYTTKMFLQTNGAF